MWLYSQSSGRLSRDGALIAVCYSGNGKGLNNPKMQDIHGIGPIPQGLWRIVRWDDQHGDKGPQVAVLEPDGHDAFGRSAFLVHGDNSEMNHTASHGCIIAPRHARDQLRASGEMEIEVTA